MVDFYCRLIEVGDTVLVCPMVRGTPDEDNPVATYRVIEGMLLTKGDQQWPMMALYKLLPENTRIVKK